MELFNYGHFYLIPLKLFNITNLTYDSIAQKGSMISALHFLPKIKDTSAEVQKGGLRDTFQIFGIHLN